MRDRRSFLKSLGQLAACGLVTARTGTAVIQEPGRRQISIAGRRVPVVDIHAHCVFPDAATMIDGTPLAGRAFPQAWTLGPERIGVMDARGIDIQVLSVNNYWWYEADAGLATDIVRLHDTQLAAWCRMFPGRFVALSSVALQHPDLAAEQLEYAVGELGLRGASIGGHVGGEPPSSSRFDPFWARAEALGVPVFMHPNGAGNVVRDGGLAGRGDLGNIIGNPLETTVFLTHMIFDGTLDRFPRLRVCAAHAGGYLPSYLGRTEVACDVRTNAECATRRRPSEYLQDQIMVDSMIFSEEGLRHLVAETGPGQVVYGSDIPFDWPDTIDLILEAPFLDDADKARILGGNLITLLRIEV